MIEAMLKATEDAEYPIAAVSRLTGVSCHALRAWERRYGFPAPHRSLSGHRRYRFHQIVALRRILELLEQGAGVGEAIETVVRDAKASEAPPKAVPPPEPPTEARPDRVSELLERLLEGDAHGADVVLERVREAMSPEQLATEVLGPALTETGERWFRKRCGVFQEHSATGYLRRKLDAMIESNRRGLGADSRTVVLGTVQGDRHEGGVLIAHLLLEGAGWKVVNVGVDLPTAEYVKAVERCRAHALALSFVLSRNVNKRFQELSAIQTVPVFLGGRSILNYQGLARKHGLIPLLGPAPEAIAMMAKEYDAWVAKQRQDDAPSP